jgi:hypothetical protein
MCMGPNRHAQSDVRLIKTPLDLPALLPGKRMGDADGEMVARHYNSTTMEGRCSKSGATYSNRHDASTNE